MKVLFIVDEDIVNYKEASMFIGFPFCSCKCDIDNGSTVCQNDILKDQPLIDIPAEELVKRYLENDITHAIVLGGREPFDSPFDLITLVDTLRNMFSCDDTICIYTGYDKEELEGYHEKTYPGINYEKLHACYEQLKRFNNIIIKYGRYIPGQPSHADQVLGVRLASSNQFAEMLQYEG